MINPEKMTQTILNNKTLSGLEMRASHIPSFAEVTLPNIQLNTSLLKQKKDLENRITNLKEKIVHEKKLLNNA